MKTYCILLVLIVCVAIAEADIIYLKTGGQLEGEILDRSDGFVKVRLEMGGTVNIREDDISSIEKKEFSLSPSAEYKRKKEGLPEGSAQGHYDLALSCIKNRLYREAMEELKTALKLDPRLKEKVEQKLQEVKEKEKSWLYSEVHFYLRRRDYKKALIYTSKLLELYPEDEIASKAKQVEDEIRSQLVKQEILEGIESTGSEESRREKILLLGIMQDSASLDVLSELLGNKDPKIRAIAIDALSLRKDKRAVPYLRKQIANKNPLIRRKAVRALGEIGDEEGVALITPLLRDKSDQTRGEAAIALRKIGSEMSMIALIKALHDENRDVRIEVIKALGEVGGSKANRALVSALRREDLRIRIEIYKALGKIADTKTVKPLLSEIRDERVPGQQQIINTLGQIASEEAVDGLIQLLGSLDRESLLEKVIVTLRKIDNVKVLPAIAKLLKHPSAHLRKKAVSALGLLKDKRAIPYLKEALRDPSDLVRMEAARAIQKIGKDN